MAAVEGRDTQREMTWTLLWSLGGCGGGGGGGKRERQMRGRRCCHSVVVVEAASLIQRYSLERKPRQRHSLAGQ